MSLVFAMTRENGMMALDIPNGAHLDMTPPLNTEQLDQYNITGDIKRMKELMSPMTPSEVRALTIRMGADPAEVPKKRKEVLVAQFIDRFEKTRKEFEAIRPSLLASSSTSTSPAPDTGFGIGVVSLNEDMSDAEILAEVRRQIPDLANASDEVIERYLENASRVERAEDGRMTTRPHNPLNPASSTAPPTSTPPVPENPAVKAFSGRAYKLSGDVDATVEEEETKEFKDGKADFSKHHIKPDLQVRVLPYENAPKDNYTVDTSGRDYYDVELTEKNASTKGTAFIELECQKAKFKFIFNYTEKDKVKDILELIELNTDIKMEQMVLFYRGGKSYCQNHEPLWATILKMGGNEFKLCVRALGGGKTTTKRVKKQSLTKPEKLKKARTDAQKVADKEASALKCMADSNDALTTFYTLAEKDPAEAFLKAIDKMSEADLGKAYDSIKGDIGGTTEQKLKVFSTHLFGAPLAEISDLYSITGGILETANLSVSLAYDWGVEKDCVSLSFLRATLKSKLDRRIGAREQAESSNATRAMEM
eukprot:s1996_g2.t1